MAFTYEHYYDFSNTPYFTEMNKVFSDIFDRSVVYFINNPDSYNTRFGLKKLVEYVRDLEKSLVGLINLGYVTTNNLSLVKDTYKNIDTIGLLNSCYKGRIYGLTNSKRIEINPQLSNSKNLNSMDRTLLYICHEVGHRFHYGWSRNDNVSDLLNDKEIRKYHDRLPDDTKQYIYSGYDLLDEALTQDRAEEITYYFKGIPRPSLALSRSRLFDAAPFKSNFDYYRELQEVAIKFAKTLNYISKSDYEALKQLSRAAIDNDFAKKIEYEYRYKGKIIELYALLHSMGIIKEASYEAFGMGTKNSILRSSKALKLINSLTEQEPNNRKRYDK